MNAEKFKTLSSAERQTYLWLLSPITGHLEDFKKYLALYIKLEKKAP